jgi:anti-sigma-K factor RskA
MNGNVDTRFWRGTTAVLAIAVLALTVAATIRRHRPDFANRPVLAVIRDGSGRPVWNIRLARAAHEIAAQSVRAAAEPAGRGFELWLTPAAAATPRPLGLLPSAGQRVIPVMPRYAALLAGRGALFVTLETSEGSPSLQPSGPPVFRGRLSGLVIK